jgi:hypothetical protein
MKLLLHIVRKDARALSTLWSLWVALIAAQIGVASKLSGTGAMAPIYWKLGAGLAVLAIGVSLMERSRRLPDWAKIGLGLLRVGLSAVIVGVAVSALVPSTLDMYRFFTVRLYFNALGSAWMLFAYILTAAAILQDAPVGTRMFWATRPISGGMLLRAKLISLLIFLVVTPALVWLPWRIHCGFGPVDLLEESLKTMLWSAAAVAPAIVLAALSGDGARFMLYNVVGLAGGATLGTILAGYSLAAGQAVIITRILMGAGVLVVLAAAAVIDQYRSRRWARSIALLLAGIAVGSIVGACARLDGSVWFRSRPAPAAFAASIRIASADFRLERTPTPAGFIRGSLHLRLQGVPEDVRCAPALASMDVTWADGSHAAFPEIQLQAGDDGSFAVAGALGLPVLRSDPETLAKDLADDNERRVRSGRSILAAWPEDTRDLDYWGELYVAPESVGKLHRGGAKATLHFVGAFRRPTVLFETPISVGTRRAGDGLRIDVMESHVQVNEKTSIRTVGAWIGIERATVPDLEIFAVERGTPGGVFGIGHGLMDFADGSAFFERIDRIHLAFPVPRLWRTDHWIDAPDWTAAVSLAAVRFRPVGVVDCSTQVPFGD